MTMYARLGTKDRSQIHCGACGKAFAFIVVVSGADPPSAARVVVLPEGWWRRDDGVWELSKTAQKKLRRGYPM